MMGKAFPISDLICSPRCYPRHFLLTRITIRTVKLESAVPKTAETGWTARRRHMIATQLIPRGIHDPRVLDAMRDLPREQFVEGEARLYCYRDEPVGIGHHQTLSQPYMAALMAQTLALTGSETVLEIGAGCGFHAALLARLAARVYAIEIVPELAAAASANLARTGHHNVEVICGDGSAGWPARAPYEAISVAAAAPAVPPTLSDQLAPGGRLVIPVGSREDQDLLLIERSPTGCTTSTVTGCRFVPLIGRHGWQ